MVVWTILVQHTFRQYRGHSLLEGRAPHMHLIWQLSAPKSRDALRLRRRFFQARKKNPNLNFWVRIFSGGMGVFHVKGWGPKSSVCPSKPRESNFFGGKSRDFAGISRQKARKVWEKNVWVQFSSPIFTAPRKNRATLWGPKMRDFLCEENR